MSIADHVRERWWGEHADALASFVAVPSVSPAFDADWATDGSLSAVVGLVADWFFDRHSLPGTQTHVLPLEGRTPLLVVEVPGSTADEGENPSPVLVYGHLDVQPPGGGWQVTDAFRPVLHDSLLYGRGTGDDKYVPLALVSALEALRAEGRDHPPVVLLLETSEESSSVDLPAHLAAHGELLGQPQLIVCLDTFVPDQSTLWHAGSMRGIVVADLTVSVASEGMHSGLVGGVSPSSFRLLRVLLDRVEDAVTGACLLPELRTQVPGQHREALRRQAELTGAPSERLPLLPGVRPQVDDAVEQLITQSWSPTIAYVGVDGMPPTGAAGSVLRASTTVRLSIRLPPTVRATDAARALRETFESNPPAGATVRFDVHGAQDGWNATAPEGLRVLLDRASVDGYGSAAAECGGGATIPPLAMLAERFPGVPVVPLGVVTPESHPHGPDENIDLESAARLSASLATLLNAHASPTPTPESTQEHPA